MKIYENFSILSINITLRSIEKKNTNNNISKKNKMQFFKIKKYYFCVLSGKNVFSVSKI